MLKFERYELRSEKTLTVFEFVSEGPKGKIPKFVQFSETNVKGVYNLGFGDKDNLTDEIDDEVISNNGDSRKVLATVAATVYAFTDRYTNAWVYAAGSTKARTRLYRMGISNNLAEISRDFEVYGLKNGEWVKFTQELIMTRFSSDENSMKIKELNKTKLPIVRLEKKLEKYNEKNLFPAKLDKANEVLMAVGLPKPKKHVKASNKSPKHPPIRRDRV